MLTGRTGNAFSAYVHRAHRAGRLVVQPRMGFGDPAAMRAGLLAVRGVPAATVGTITLDSYTRLNQHDAARHSLARGSALNGYPLVVHGATVNRSLLDGVHGPDFPVQVRHGSSEPRQIISALVRAGLDTTEGGPVSYCLPYGRTPLRESVRNWAACCALLGEVRERGGEPHLETFGGCMLGQLCPPGLLVALSVLECLFFRQHGLRSVSLSYAQQTDPGQDTQAVLALRQLAGELLGDLDWHIVLYAYMGIYPRTRAGALALLEQAAALAVRTGAERFIVKTVSEGFRIPSVAENVEALETAAAAARRTAAAPAAPARWAGPAGNAVLAEARALVECVLDLDDDIGAALVTAFARGYLDVPYCLHPDNAGRSRSHIDARGRLRWGHTGSMPISPAPADRGRPELGANDLLTSLRYVQRKFDEPWEQPTPIPDHPEWSLRD